jgi:xanthine dehydrogenase YagR molybdenum-binding subunit
LKHRRPDLDVSFTEDEVDGHAPAGREGVGELALVGAGPAIGDTVFCATGVRLRERPIRPERLLPMARRPRLAVVPSSA